MHLTELISGLIPESLDGHIGQIKALKLAFVALSHETCHRHDDMCDDTGEHANMALT